MHFYLSQLLSVVISLRWEIYLILRKMAAKHLSLNECSLSVCHSCLPQCPRKKASSRAPDLGAQRLLLKRALHFRTEQQGSDTLPISFFKIFLKILYLRGSKINDCYCFTKDTLSWKWLFVPVSARWLKMHQVLARFADCLDLSRGTRGLPATVSASSLQISTHLKGQTNLVFLWNSFDDYLVASYLLQ